MKYFAIFSAITLSNFYFRSFQVSYVTSEHGRDTALLNFYLDREQVKSSYKILLVSLTLVGSR